MSNFIRPEKRLFTKTSLTIVLAREQRERQKCVSLFGYQTEQVSPKYMYSYLKE